MRVDLTDLGNYVCHTMCAPHFKSLEEFIEDIYGIQLKLDFLPDSYMPLTLTLSKILSEENPHLTFFIKIGSFWHRYGTGDKILMIIYRNNILKILTPEPICDGYMCLRPAGLDPFNRSPLYLPIIDIDMPTYRGAQVEIPAGMEENSFDLVGSSVPEDSRLLNLGGAGDCALRCLSVGISEFTEPMSIDSFYQSLDLPMYTYLEETHLARISIGYNLELTVFRLFNGEIVRQVFGIKGGHRISLYNKYPDHYYIIAALKSEEPEVEIQQESASSSDNSGSDSELSQSEEYETVEACYYSLPQAPEFSTLASFLYHTKDFVYPDVLTLLSAFEQAHCETVMMINELGQDRVPRSEFFKLYYKFRHNVFGSLCRMALGLPVTALDTDDDLSKYLPGSKKTPDTIVEDESCIHILEYSVSNRYETLDFNKGGGNRSVKYSEESEAISKLRNKPCKIHILGLVLNENNFEEIRLQLSSIYKDSNDFGSFQTFSNICNTSRDTLNSGQVRSEQAYDLPPLKTDLPSYSRPDSFKTMMVTPTLLTKALEKSKYCLNNFHYILSSFRKKRITVIYDTETDTLRLESASIHKKHFPTAPDFISAIRADPMSAMLKALQVRSGSKIVPLSSLRGNIPVTMHRMEKSNIKAYEVPFIDAPYFRPMPIEGEYQVLETDGFHKLGNANKVFFPPNYWQQLNTHDYDNIMSSKSRSMLVNCKFDVEDLEECMHIFQTKYKQANQVSNMDYNPRPTFMLPILSDYQKGENVSASMLSLCAEKVGGLTSIVLTKASQGKFVEVMNKNEMSLAIHGARERLNSAKHKLFLKSCKLKVVKPWKSLTEREKLSLRNEKASVDTFQREYVSMLSKAKGSRRENMVKLNMSKNNLNHKKFKDEMSHFQGEKNVFKGVGMLDGEQATDFFSSFIRSMSDVEAIVPEPMYNRVRSPGPKFLNSLKNMHTDRYDQFFDSHFKGKRVDSITQMYAAVSQHLINESCKSYNGSYFKVESLGYKNLLVIVKGGSKLYRHQKSKLYRLCALVKSSEVRFLGYEGNRSTKCYPMGDRTLIITPWAQMQQDVLFDYITLRQRSFMNLFSAHVRTGAETHAPIEDLFYIPLILSLNNRRKTEQFMHNSRYLIVNPLARNANLQGIIGSFAGFNYTYVDLWLRNGLLCNYPSFARSLIKARAFGSSKIDSLLGLGQVRDIWLDRPITSADQLTSFIYITYMMTKAPVNSSLEQASNLWEILEDISQFDKVHGDVNKLDDTSLRFNVLKDTDDVYNDDFKYDPVFCNFLGFYLSSYLRDSLRPVEVHNAWSRFWDEDLDVIANSNGLRGWKEDNFYNKKGYEIVFSKISESVDSDSLLGTVATYLESSNSTTYSMIQNDKLQREDYLPDELIFHIVHKIQRGGSREIFCMDLPTKVAQSPIEKLFKFICKRIPNEFISIPSNRRHGRIHSDFYERKPGWSVKKIMRWVLDCRRWAPHSVFQKYVYFIEGMSDYFPAHFVLFFRSFADKMMSKTFITRQHVYDKIVNNKRFSKYKDLLTMSKKISNTFNLTVRFSFVMGIFNYLSTMMHAANQLVASEIIRYQSMSNGHGLTIMDPKCHSDDSVVTSYHEEEASIDPAVKLYDWLLKGGNHMLSVKKSQVNEDIYVEFLSVLYLFDRYLPVLPKFASTLPFKPSDNGYASDITFAITQSLEMLSQGGSYEECFLMLKLTERFVQNVYRLNFVADLPFNFLGSIDSHPIELLYAGGMADIYRFKRYNTTLFNKIYNMLFNMKLLQPDTGEVSLKWDMGARLDRTSKDIMFKYKKVMDSLPDSCKWTITNNKLGNAKLNLIWYLNKLSDRKFHAALVNEPDSRRYSRIFGSGSYRTLRSSEGTQVSVPKLGIAMQEILDGAEVSSEPPDGVEFLDFCCHDLASFYDAIDDAEFTEITSSNIKEKPIIFSQGESVLGNVDMSAAEYTSYIKEPDGYKLLGKRSNPARQASKISSHLGMMGVDVDSLTPDQLYSVSRLVTKEASKSYRLIMPLPGDLRVSKDYTTAVSTIAYNSIKWKKLQVRAKMSSIIDWKEKIMGGSLPKSVIEYLEITWVLDLLDKYSLSSLPIFKTPLAEAVSLKFKEVPKQWRPIMKTSVSTGDMLVNVNYWLRWIKSQVRLGGTWYGEGECHIMTPEAFLQIFVVSGRIMDIKVISEHTGPFSEATSWYLSIFFNFSGFQVDVFSSDFAVPGQKYLCYDQATSSHLYTSSPKGMMLYSDSRESPDSIPSYAYSTVNNVRKARNGFVVVEPDGEYKVEMYVPVEKPVILDLAKFLDPEKMKALMPDYPALNNFVRDYAINTLGTSRTDPTILRQNFDRSLIYNIIYEYSEYRNLLSSSFEDTSFYIAAMEWKDNHPSFGFPTADEMDQLRKNQQVVPFAPQVKKMVSRLGNLKLTKPEMDSLMVKLLILPDSDRSMFLASNFPKLAGEQGIELLTLVSKSKRIYHSCTFTLRKAIYLFSSVMDHFINSFVNSNIRDEALTRILNQYNHNGNVTPEQVLRNCTAQFIYDSMYCTKVQASDLVSWNFLIKFFSRTMCPSYKAWLSVQGSENPMLKSVDFDVENEIILSWLVDLADNLTMWKGKMDKVLSPAGLRKSKLKIAKEVQDEATSFLKYIYYPGRNPRFPLEIEIYKRASRRNKTKSKKLTLELCTDVSPGIMAIKHYKLDEESTEEFEFSYEYEEVFDDYIADPNPKYEEMYAYCFVYCLDLASMSKYRANADNVLYGFYVMNPSLSSNPNTMIYYVREEKRNLTTHFQERLKICYTGSKSAAPSISGFRRMRDEEVLRLYSNTPSEIEIDGQKIRKEDVFKTPSLLAKRDTLEHYLAATRAEVIEEEVEIQEKVIDKVNDYFFMDPDSETNMKELKSRIGKYRMEKEQKGKSDNLGPKGDRIDKPAEKVEITLTEILEGQQQFLGKIKEAAGGGGMEVEVSGGASLYQMKNPMDLITDPRFHSEINALIPGVWDKILHGELSLTLEEKLNRKALAMYKIFNMTGRDKQLGSMMYKFLCMLLNEVPEYGGVRHLSADFALKLDQLFAIPEDLMSSGLAPAHTIMAQGVMNMDEDLEIIFGK
nr:polyprotein [Phytophthora cactorum bunyavirus 3]